MTRGRFAGLLAILIFGLFPGVVLGFHTFAFRDFGSFGYPVAHFFRDSILRGEAPLWNPLNNCGLPFLAQWSTMAVYPGDLLFLLGPLSWTVPMFCLGHLWLGGLGMYCLAERWTRHPTAASIAGVIFAFNGLSLNALMWPNYSASLGWLPWVLLLAGRAWVEGGRWLPAAALAGAMQMLAGPPEVVMATWILVAGLWVPQVCETGLSWPQVRRPVVVVSLVSGLAAIQLVPFYELLRHSQRNADFGGSDFAMPGTGWANLLIPLFDYVKTPAGLYLQPYQGFTSSYYPGAGALLLAILAVWRVGGARAWVLAGLAAVSLTGAMGDNGAMFPALRSIFPGLGLMRFPIKLIILLMPCVALLAALAVVRLSTAEPGRAGRDWRASAGLAGLMAATMAGLLWFEFRYPATLTPWPVVAWNAAGRLVLAAGALGVLYLASRARGSVAGGLAVIGLPLIFWLDYVTHMPPQNPTVDAAVHRLDLSTVRGLQPAPALAGPRVMLRQDAMLKLYYSISPNLARTYLGRRFGLYMNCNLLEGIPKTDGFYSLYLSQEDALRRRLERSVEPPAGLLDFMGVGQVGMLGVVPAAGGGKVASEDTQLDWTARRGWMPLVSAGQSPVMVTEAAALDRLFRPDVDLRREVILTREGEEPPAVRAGSEARVESIGASSQRIEATVTAEQASMVVVAQGWYPAWRAMVDGRPVRLWRANAAFQALEVPAGRHEVTLIYRDRWFAAGAVISLLTLIGVLSGLKALPRPVFRTTGAP